MSSDLITVHETCGCGASLSVTCQWPSDADRMTAAWRADHQHDMRAGDTTDEAPEQRGTSAAQIEIGFQQREDTVMARG